MRKSQRTLHINSGISPQAEPVDHLLAKNHTLSTWNHYLKLALTGD